MKIYIIGNGFDRAHGLQTSYWDFREYLEALYPEFLNGFEEHYSIYPGTVEKSKKDILWNEMETNLANIDEDVIIEQADGIELRLESGDVEIEDTLFAYFTEMYDYIKLLAKYLKQWVRTIRIRDVMRIASAIDNAEDAIYITFNYTAVLETGYKISADKIIHIHGSLRAKDGEPILGHGNISRIKDIERKLKVAEREYNERRSSICKVVKNYYEDTFKDINRFMFRLSGLRNKAVDEIIVVGHSLAGVDLPYFEQIDILTHNTARWKVYYHSISEKQRMFDSLVHCRIAKGRIEMLQSSDFFLK